MKTLGILGIVFNSLLILSSLSVLADDGVWLVVLVLVFNLALSIQVVKESK